MHGAKQIPTQYKNLEQASMHNSNLETLDEERGPLLPSSVTTSNPTLSPPSLTSPANRDSTPKLVKFVVINCTVERTGVREGEATQYGCRIREWWGSGESLWGFRTPAWPASSSPRPASTRSRSREAVVGRKEEHSERFQGAYRRASDEEAPRRRGGHWPARQAAAGGGSSSDFCDSSDLLHSHGRRRKPIFYVTEVSRVRSMGSILDGLGPMCDLFNRTARTLITYFLRCSKTYFLRRIIVFLWSNPYPYLYIYFLILVEPSSLNNFSLLRTHIYIYIYIYIYI
jgi:hypothetical protein